MTTFTSVRAATDAGIAASSGSVLFSPLALGPLVLPNRIMISPMCQYSAIDGNAQAWHTVHLGNLAISGAGLLCLEATAVCPEGRITHGCLGLYDEDNEAALKKVLENLRAVSNMSLAIQLAHAGRKASSQVPWDGGELIPPAAGGWQPEGPSAIPYQPGEAAPHEMTLADIQRVVAQFAASAERARRLGFDAIELHAAHGYLLHEFLSPLANQRTDEYGGSLGNRMRFPLEVLAAVRDVVGADIPVGIRLSATDWVDGGWDIDGSVVFCKQAEAAGCAFIDVSSGGMSPAQKIPIGPAYQVPLAERIKHAVSIPVIAVGLITEPRQAEDIVRAGRADMVALARGILNDPRWPWRAAMQLGGTLSAPRQFWRCLPAGSPRVFGDVRIGQR